MEWEGNKKKRFVGMGWVSGRRPSRHEIAVFPFALLLFTARLAPLAEFSLIRAFQSRKYFGLLTRRCSSIRAMFAERLSLNYRILENCLRVPNVGLCFIIPSMNARASDSNSVFAEYAALLIQLYGSINMVAFLI